MKLDVKKRLEKRIAMGILAVGLLLACSLTAYAKKNSGQNQKDGFTVYGNNEITSIQAIGDTSGGSGAYRNKVAVYDHDKEGKFLNGSEKTGVAEAKASATVTHINSYKVNSFHFIIDPSGNDVVSLFLTTSLDN